MNLYSKTLEELHSIYEAKLDRLPSRAPIYTPTERVHIRDRIRGVDHVTKIYNEDLDAIYRPKLRALREQFKHTRRCFLIGNGPSLNLTDLRMLKGEVTFAVNGFFMKANDIDWTPTFYLVEDHLVAEDRAHAIRAFRGPIKLFPAYLGYVFPKDEDTIFYNHRPRVSYPHGFDFSLEADQITYTGCTVTFSMMQIAAYLGFREIYLIGVDASYDVPTDAKQDAAYGVGVLDMKSDDPNHFDPDYFGKGYRWHDPQVSEMIAAYQEAKRALEGTGQTIYNATVGGKLEVFERRSFHSLFPQARSPEEMAVANEAIRCSRYPRLLMFDMTAMGDGSATGELKASLFDGWPSDRLLQISRHGRSGLALVEPTQDSGAAVTPVEEPEALSAIDTFSADVILYRPVPKVPWLHDLAMRTIRRLDKPVVTWIMDDWPADLAQTDASQWATLGPDLIELFARSSACLSISHAMSEAFRLRYGISFSPIANGVNPVHWGAGKHHEGKALRVRYAGGLAKNMSLASVLRIARAVESLASSGHDISLEINTRKCWLTDAEPLFSELSRTHIDTETRSDEDYQRWLRDADVLVIAYNHDPETLRYVRYSMANKMPECLASGAVVLAHGPRDIATIAYLASTDAAVVVEEESDEDVERALLDLLDNPEKRNILAERARERAFTRHSILKQREALRSRIVDAAQGSDHPSVAVRNSASPRPSTSYGGPPVKGTDRILDQLLQSHDTASRQLLLKYVASNLLLDPKSSIEQLAVGTAARAAVDRALARLSDGDALKAHFQRVHQHAAGSVRHRRPL